MKKIILIVIIAILLVLSCVMAINGMKIGGLKISSFKQLGDDNKGLDNKIKQLNSTIDVNYPNKVEELKKASKKMQESRGEYLDTLTFSENADLESSLMIKNYDIERLWARVGNHAIDAGVNITLEIKQGSSAETKDLNFTVKGTYLAQTNFLYAIEDDEELAFRIYEFKLLPGEGTILQGTFIVKDVRITDSLNETLDSSSSSSTSKGEAVADDEISKDGESAISDDTSNDGTQMMTDDTSKGGSSTKSSDTSKNGNTSENSDSKSGSNSSTESKKP